LAIGEKGGGPASGNNRVMRGGSWNNTAMNCRSAFRNNNNPDNNNNGFRLLSTMRTTGTVPSGIASVPQMRKQTCHVPGHRYLREKRGESSAGIF
jgi:hypothetical protein